MNKKDLQNLIKELKEFVMYLRIEEAKTPLRMIEEEIEQLRMKIWFLIRALEEIKKEE